MTKIFIATAFACILSLSARANNDAGIEGVAFGSNYETTLAGIRSTFGTPIQANKQQIVYKDMTFKGLKFEKAIFKFQIVKSNPAPPVSSPASSSLLIPSQVLRSLIL